MFYAVFQGNDNSIIVMDSVSYMDEAKKGDIIVCGSHGGESAAKHLLKFMPGGAIFNDAGKGKDNAGISGLKLFDETGIPAATVDTFSAKIGDGTDTYKSGIISALNDAAAKCGVSIGMSAKDAALKMLIAKETIKECDY